MFETADHAEIPIPVEFRAQGERAWAYVEFPLHVPWFHLVYEIKVEDGVQLRRPIFLSEVEQLVTFCARAPRIYEVQVVLPGHLTGARRWTMEPLKEIWRGREPAAPGQTAFVYVLGNGKRYLDSGLSEHEAELLEPECIYRRKSASTKKEKGSAP